MLTVGKWLVSGSYGLFLLLYIYAVAAYGLTRTGQLPIFECALGFAFLVWFGGYAVQGKLPCTGFWPALLATAVLAFGWIVTGLGWINDHIDDNDIPSWAGKLPAEILTNWSTYDTEVSISAMLLKTALLGGMLMAIDFWNHAGRARGLVATIVISSLGMVFFFFLQRIVGAPFILMSEDGTTPLIFATYRYHGNAAAYLNLCWPITAAVAIFAAVRQSAGWPFWFLPLAATLVATFLNVSKAGNVLAPLGIVILLLVLIPYLRHEIKRSKNRIRRSRVLVALVPIVIIVASVPFAIPWKRWDYFTKTADLPGGRMTAYAEFVKMIPEGGATGLGPGTFPVFSRSYTEGNPFLNKGWYRSAHEDYIQTIIEWGYIGTCLWGFLLVPPFIFLFSMARGGSRRSSSEFEGYRIGILDHVKGFFETMPGPRQACLAAGAFTAVTLTAIHAIYDFPMQIASLQFYFLTLLALGWSYRTADRSLVNPQ